MKLKVRLYRGPFDGKVLKNWSGGSTIVLNGIKKVSKKERYRQFMDRKPTDQIFPDVFTVTGVYYATPFMHPDGSRFYEWDKPRKTRSPHQRNQNPLP